MEWVLAGHDPEHGMRGTYEYRNDDGISLAALKHDGEQYRSIMGVPLGKKFEDAKRKLELEVNQPAVRRRKR